MAMSYRLILTTVAALALGACGTVNKNIGQEDLAVGEAVKYDFAIQTINPDPVYPQGSALPGSNADKGAQAVKRYRMDQVKALETMGTTSAGGGSGSSPH
jgi:hypothetical protein